MMSMIPKSGFLQILMVFVLWLPSAAGQPRCIVAMSMERPGFAAIRKQFEHSMGIRCETIFVNRLDRAEFVDLVTEEKPDLAVVTGCDALEGAIGVEKIPVLYSEVYKPGSIIGDGKNFTGVDVALSEETQLDLLLLAMPGLRRDSRTAKRKRIGLLYSDESEHRASNARKAAARRNVELRCVKLGKNQYMPIVLEEFKKEFDVFWMIPDVSMYTKRRVEHLLIFCELSGKAVVTFSEKYVEEGALIGLGVDPSGVGDQLARMARRILGGTPAADIPPEHPEKPFITVNYKTARKLGVEFPAAFRKMVNVPY